MSNFLKPRRGKFETAKAQLKGNNALKSGEIFFEVPSTGVGTGQGKIKMGGAVDGSLVDYEFLPYFFNPDDFLSIAPGHETKFTKSNVGDNASMATVLSSLDSNISVNDGRSFIRRGLELLNTSLNDISSEITTINSTLDTGVGKSLAYNSASKQIELRSSYQGRLLSGITVGYATNAASANSATTATEADKANTDNKGNTIHTSYGASIYVDSNDKIGLLAKNGTSKLGDPVTVPYAVKASYLVKWKGKNKNEASTFSSGNFNFFCNKIKKNDYPAGSKFCVNISNIIAKEEYNGREYNVTAADFSVDIKDNLTNILIRFYSDSGQVHTYTFKSLWVAKSNIEDAPKYFLISIVDTTINSFYIESFDYSISPYKSDQDQ